MKCLNAEHPDGEPLPDWEVHLRDGFGRPGDALGGVTGLVANADAALAAFLAAFPNLAKYPLIAVRSSIAPAWSSYEWA
jgi:hypothetical protein